MLGLLEGKKLGILYLSNKEEKSFKVSEIMKDDDRKMKSSLKDLKLLTSQMSYRKL